MMCRPVPMLSRYVLATSLVLTLILGNLLHSAISHSHASPDGHAHEHSYGPRIPDTQEERTSAIWQSLHGALRHEEKHTLLLLALIDILLLILIVRAINRSIGARAPWPDIEHGFSAGRWLTAGLAPYRRFA